jgi:hypothetical protein
MKLVASLPLLALVAAACGPSGPPPEPVGKRKPGELPAPLDAFHDVLAPLWHDATPERRPRTCAAREELATRGAALRGVATAEPEDWAIQVRALEDALAKVAAACDGQGDFELAFSETHDRFHVLLERFGGHAEGHGDHEAPGEGHEHHP